MTQVEQNETLVFNDVVIDRMTNLYDTINCTHGRGRERRDTMYFSDTFRTKSFFIGLRQLKTFFLH
jgi:hypothetical protein